MARVHFSNVFIRDMSKYMKDQEMTTKRSGTTLRRNDVEIPVYLPYPFGLRSYFAIPSLLLVEGALAPISSSRLALGEI